MNQTPEPVAPAVGLTPRTDEFAAKMREMYYPHALGEPYQRSIEHAKEMETHAGELLKALALKQRHDLDSDSIVASCNCLTKTPEVRHHAIGCKYRLIVERDTAQEALEDLLQFCDTTPSGETEFERAIIRARKAIARATTQKAKSK